MFHLLRAAWWVLLVRGLVAVAFGVMALAWPTLTLQALILLFGAYALVDGGLAVYAALRARPEHSDWWAVALEGAIGLIAGVLVLVWPGLGAVALLYFIAAWAIITGVAEIIMAYRLRQVLSNEWLMVLAGVASVSFGVLVWIYPGAGALALVTFIGVYALIFGLSLVGLSLRLRMAA